MVYVLPLLCFVIPLIAGAVLLRAGRGVIVAMLMWAPGLLGLLVGSAVGWWHSRRTGLRG
ncbi:hypothetical protein [Roseovarius sp.]|uniref:hypothetical protein n=1 Tax=Roseovarius sp. TaxID=1486281 RepID=UPI003BA8B61A